jgi:hypothetical protein
MAMSGHNHATRRRRKGTGAAVHPVFDCKRPDKSASLEAEVHKQLPLLYAP